MLLLPLCSVVHITGKCLQLQPVSLNNLQCRIASKKLEAHVFYCLPSISLSMNYAYSRSSSQCCVESRDFFVLEAMMCNGVWGRTNINNGPQTDLLFIRFFKFIIKQHVLCIEELLSQGLG